MTDHDHYGFGIAFGMMPILLMTLFLDLIPDTLPWLLGLVAFMGASLFLGDRFVCRLMCDRPQSNGGEQDE